MPHNKLIIIIILALGFSNSRVAFSRPGSTLRTPGNPIEQVGKPAPLFSVGFSSEAVNLDLPSLSSCIYIQGTTSNGYQLGLSYTSLSDPRSRNEIIPETAYDSEGNEMPSEADDYVIPTEVGIHLQKRVYSAGNINIDVGINDILARNVDGNSQFQNPSFFTLFSSKKEFDKYSIIFNYGFGTGKIAQDQQLSEEGFSKDQEFVFSPYLGFNLLTPEIRRLKNSMNILFEYDGTGINLGAKIPITDEYLLSFGVVHFSNMGDFGIRSKTGNYDALIAEDAATLCFGFQMNIPKPTPNVLANPFTTYSPTPEGADSTDISSNINDAVYTGTAVKNLADSLNAIINNQAAKHSSVIDSIRFLTFSLENVNIENTSYLHKISTLEDSISQNHHQKALDIKNFNKATRHISKSLRYFYEKNFQKALIEIDKAIEINPNLAIAYARKGTIYYSMGQTQNASINWNIALKLDPEYDEVRDILEALKENRLQSANLEGKK